MPDQAQDTRPAWSFKIPIEQAKKLRGRKVTRIDQHEEHDGYGINSDYWLTLHFEGGGKIEKFRQPLNEHVFRAEVRFQMPDNRGLVLLHEDIAKRLDEIERWDRKHRGERATYERLKRKFEGGDHA